ncbi:MAG: serine/threonine protein kinase, partial [Marinicellaceae bacterium]
MMTDSQKSFVKVKLWFSNLIAEPASEQKSQINQLRKDGTLDDKQIKLLQDMLQADQETSMATNIESVSSEIIEEATAQEPTFENKQIGSYKIISTLGEGGMGQVYLAERNDGQFQQKVALKLPHSSFNQHMLERFENERQILAQLTHNNIAHLLDGGTAENNQPYLVMEYIQGKNIDEYCSEKIPNLQERLQLILQVCAAVTFSHQQLVLHRDLKPSN